MFLNRSLPYSAAIYPQEVSVWAAALLAAGMMDMFKPN